MRKYILKVFNQSGEMIVDCFLSDPHLAFKFKILSFNLFLHLSRSHSVSMRSVTYTVEI